MAHVNLFRLSRCLAVLLLFGLVMAPSVYARDTRLTAMAPKQITRASWYGKSFQGKPTAGGDRFNLHRLTAAHRTINLGSRVKVTELRSGRSVVVQITDRGPFLPGRGIDLSYAAARELGIIRRGVARVRVEILEHEPPVSKAPLVTAWSWPVSSWLPQAIAE